MVVQHNLTAMNANRMLGVTTKQQAKSSEKLSSGYKINRAADDAAGLSISEKMRKQMKGLDRASTNAEDGVSAVQTAEGALAEVHSMLQRMNELSVQAANGTNSKDDRDAIQAEIEQLTSEIDRVAETTKFNETYLLKGATDGSTATKTLAFTEAGLVGKWGTPAADGSNTFTIAELKEGDKIVVAGVQYEVLAADAAANIPSENKYTAAHLYENMIKPALQQANQIGAEVGGEVTVANPATNVFTISAPTVTVPKSLAFSLHVGADAEMSNKIVVDVEAMTSAGLGIKKMNVSDTTGIAATYAIDRIAGAISYVSAQRSSLGAVQNRLEHTIANLDNVAENTTAAESRIRDTDMAEEMVEFSKNNILMQAGQSVLAQANQATQGVLSLLQ